MHRRTVLGPAQPVPASRMNAQVNPHYGVLAPHRLRELEREVRELRLKNEFLGKAAAFFAQEYR